MGHKSSGWKLLWLIFLLNQEYKFHEIHNCLDYSVIISWMAFFMALGIQLWFNFIIQYSTIWNHFFELVTLSMSYRL